MPGGLKKKSLRTELDLTPKQKMFVEIYVKDWGLSLIHISEPRDRQKSRMPSSA